MSGKGMTSSSPAKAERPLWVFKKRSLLPTIRAT